MSKRFNQNENETYSAVEAANFLAMQYPDTGEYGNAKNYSEYLFMKAFPETEIDGVVYLCYVGNNPQSPKIYKGDFKSKFDYEGCYRGNRADWYDENKENVTIYNTPEGNRFSVGFGYGRKTEHPKKDFILSPSDKDYLG